LQRLQDLFPRVHVDRVVVGWTAELALLWCRRVPERHTQTAADAQIRANRANHASVPIRFFDNAAGHRARRLTDRARERAETAIRIDHSDRFGRLLARPTHHLRPHESEL